MRFLICLLFLTGPFTCTIHSLQAAAPPALIQVDSLPSKPEIEKTALTSAGFGLVGTALYFIAFAAPYTAVLMAVIGMGLGAIGFIKGIIALKHILKSKGKRKGLGFAIFGLTTCTFLTFALFVNCLIWLL
jgi:hypothetical protein